MAHLWALLLLGQMRVEAAPTIYYYAPPGWTRTDLGHEGEVPSGNAWLNSSANPIPFTDVDPWTAEEAFTYIANANPGDTEETEDTQVQILLKPGIYPTHPLTFNPNPSRSLTIKAENRAAGEVVFRLTNSAPSHTLDNVVTIFSNAGFPAIQYWEVQDITFDGNWDQLDSRAHPGYLKGFKTQAISLKAYSGLVKNVRAKHFGANGIVPIPWNQPQATESFPILVHAASFMAATPPGQDFPWVVEDCEVSDFHTIHNGYATAIMVTVGYAGEQGDNQQNIGGAIPPNWNWPPNPPFTPPDSCTNWCRYADWQTEPVQPGTKGHRVAVVRRCMTRGLPIGHGTAVSGGITYRDNVVIGAGKGSNYDTGPIYNIDILNSVYLDVDEGIANVGNHTLANAFKNWNISDNLVRLNSRGYVQTYMNFYWTNAGGLYFTQSAHTRPLGQLHTNTAQGLKIGGEDCITFSRNRITTRHRNHFFEPNPSLSEPSLSQYAVFRPLYAPSYDTMLMWYTGAGWAVNHGTRTIQDILVSQVPYDFGPDWDTPGDVTALRSAAVHAQGSQFDASDWFGRVGRVARVWDESQHLLSVREVAVTVKADGANGALVRARYLQHSTPEQGTGNTTLLDSAPIRLLIVPPLSENAPEWYADPTDSNFIASLSLGTFDAGQYRIIAFVDNPDAGVGGQWDPDLDFWSETEYLQGTVVRFVRSPDISRDRQRMSGTFTLRLNETKSEVFSVWVKPSNTSSFPVNQVGTIATTSIDYTLRSSSNSLLPVDDAGWYRVDFGANQSEAQVRVYPVTDDLEESELVYLEIDGSRPDYKTAPLGRGVSSHALFGPVLGRRSGCAAVAILDGAAWRCVVLDQTSPQAYYVTASALQNGSNPKIAGTCTFWNSGSYGTYSRAAYWANPMWTQPTMMIDWPSSLQVVGISDLWPGGHTEWLVGFSGTAAVCWNAYYPTTENRTTLGALATGMPALAGGINPYNAATYPYVQAPTWRIVGSAKWENNLWQPVYWDYKYDATHGIWDWGDCTAEIADDPHQRLPTPLGQFYGADYQSSGYAYAVNDSLMVVGEAALQVWEGGPNGGYQPRLNAFRTQPGLGLRPECRLLPFGSIEEPPEGPGATYYEIDGQKYYTTNSVARCINAIGDAAGSADMTATGAHKKRAAFWYANTPLRDHPELPEDLGVLAHSWRDEHGDSSEVLGINTRPEKNEDGTWKNFGSAEEPVYRSEHVQFVGWANITAGGTAKRAVWGYFYPYRYFWKEMRDLNDSAFVADLPSWKLEEARAINDQGYVVGVSLSAQKAFLLIPFPAPTE